MRLARLRITVRRHVALAAAAVVLTGLVAPPVDAAEYESFSAYIKSADGTSLHAEVFRPVDGPARNPVVLLVSPYLSDGTGDLAYQQFDELIDRGYAIVQVSLRGYSASGGCGDFGGKGEQADVKAAVEWSASQQWSTGRVGMMGVSYDAWTQVMALATKPKGLSAVLIQSPLVSLYRGLYMNGAHYGAGWNATPGVYAVTDVTPPPTEAGPEGMTNALTGTALGPTCYADNNTQTANPDSTTAYWKERDLVARARTSTVPVLWSHGFRDVNTKPDNLTALYPLLRGPKRAWVGQFGHSMPADALEPDIRELYLEEAYLWLDAYVKRDAKALRRVKAMSGAVVQQGDWRWRRDDAWPPRDSRATTFPLRGGRFVDTVVNDGSRGHAEGAVLWTFSQRLPYDVHLSGVPRVTLTAQGQAPAQVVVKVYDIDGEGNATTVTRGAHALVSGKVTFDLYPQDWRFQQGHRIGIAVLGSDGTFWDPGPPGAVSVTGASLATPALRYDRDHRPFVLDDLNDPRVEFTVEPDVIKAGEVKFPLPPRLRRG